MKKDWYLDCATCNSPHEGKKLYFKGSWHEWVAPSQQQVENRKKVKRARRKYS